MTEKMTIHKALSELKVLDSRISDAINATSFVVANKHSNTKIAGSNISDYTGKVKSDYQSIRTLIHRRNAIKRGVTKSNATTVIDVNGEKMTVAEAIDMKAKGVDYLQTLANQISAQLAHAKRIADTENGERLSAKADEYIKAMFAGVDMKNVAEETNKVRETFMQAQTVEIVDPIGAESICKELRDYTDGFLSELDSALSVSNALTTIVIEYETK